MKSFIKLLTITAMLILALNAFSQVLDPAEAEDSLKIAQEAAGAKVSTSDLDDGDDVVTVGGHIDVLEAVKGDVVCVGGTFNINALIEGDLVLIGAAGKIDSLTLVKGELVLVGTNAEIDSNAVFEGEKTNIQINGIGDLVRLMSKSRYRGDDFSIEHVFKIADVLSLIAKFIFLFILAVLIILLVKPYKRVESSILESPFFIFAMGLLTEILIVPAIVLLAISIIGIPFIPIFILALLVGLAFGWAVVVNYVGKWVTEKIWKREMHAIANVLLGLATLSIIPLIHSILTWANVSYIDSLFGFLSFMQNYVVLTFAFGGVLMSRFGTMIFVKNKAEKKQINEPADSAN